MSIIELDTKDTQDSIRWFSNGLTELKENKKANISQINKSNINNARGFKFTNGFNVNSIGSLYMYIYDPKHKNVLPKYDTFPLIILMDLHSDGFSGLNLHYLTALERHVILNRILLNNSKQINEKSKIQLNYNMLHTALLSPLKVCYKRYLFNHVRSRFLEVSPEEWKKAVLLPTANFVYNRGKK